jgi:carboxyl-terminal processing protease
MLRWGIHKAGFAALIGTLVIGIFVWGGSAVAEPRVALVIGNASYGGDIGNLANPVNDAKLIAKTLRALGFDVIEVENADQNAMKRAIVDFGNKLGDAGSEATGLFYYAGHGLQVQGENFLIPVKAHIDRESDVDVEAVPADLVLKQMDYAQSAVNIVILDACRNNPLTRGWRSTVKGLAEPERKPHGSFIAYSTAPGEVAADGKGGNSPYAKALAETIVEPGQGIEEIFRDVRAKVLAATNKEQTPWDSSSLTAPFYFQAPAPAAPAAAPVVADSVDPKRIELAFWDSIKDSKSPDDFQAYLAKYPNGDFASLAANRLKSLGAVASAAPAPDTTIRNMPPGKDDDTALVYETAFWDSVKDTGRTDDIQAYLNKYPRGKFAADAARKLKELDAPPPAPEIASVAPPPLPPIDAVDRQIYAKDQARLRASPDKAAEVIGRAPANSVLKATGRTMDGAWWRVAMADGRTAYVADSVVSEQPIVAPVAPAPAPALASQVQPAPDVSPPEPAKAGDPDTCKTDSGASAADRAAACRRMLGGELDPDARSAALIDFGNALDDLGKHDEALKNYGAALDANPRSAAAYYNIGIVQLNRQRFIEARTAFDKAASLNPDDPATIYNSAVVLGDLGDFDQALRTIKRAIGMKSDDSDYYDERALLELASGDVAAAVSAVGDAINVDSSYWSGSAVIAYYVAGDLAKADAMIDKGAKAQPDYPYWPIWRSLVRKAGGDQAAAAASLDQGLKMVGSKWPAPIMQFLAGTISEGRLRTLANTGDQRTRAEQLCEVEFYRGEAAYLAGDKATARQAMKAAAGVRIFYYLEDAAARARLTQIGQ